MPRPRRSRVRGPEATIGHGGEPGRRRPGRRSGDADGISGDVWRPLTTPARPAGSPRLGDSIVRPDRGHRAESSRAGLGASSARGAASMRRRIASCRFLGTIAGRPAGCRPTGTQRAGELDTHAWSPMPTPTPAVGAARMGGARRRRGHAAAPPSPASSDTPTWPRRPSPTSRGPEEPSRTPRHGSPRHGAAASPAVRRSDACHAGAVYIALRTADAILGGASGATPDSGSAAAARPRRILFDGTPLQKRHHAAP